MPEKETPDTTASAVTRPDRRPILFLISALVIAFDRLTKLWIVHHIAPGFTIKVIPGVFRLSHVLNTGAAFSMMENWRADYVRIGLVSFSVIAAILVFALLWRAGRAITLTSVALALILGGALGNLYDRIVLHHVVDFLAVNIYHYHWPDFNVADSCIVIGAWLLLLEIFQPEKKDVQQ
ncbi:MAG TPA: signal peptidase II [Acidobacteriaceae bacterium]|jgi:signal peptidase II|nr:signal peptidase II [Acidobacteriaceae bacterium]